MTHNQQTPPTRVQRSRDPKTYALRYGFRNRFGRMEFFSRWIDADKVHLQDVIAFHDDKRAQQEAAREAQLSDTLYDQQKDAEAEDKYRADCMAEGAALLDSVNLCEERMEL